MTTEIREILHRLPRTLRVGAVPGGLSEYTSIQAAINYAATQAPSATNPWTIYIYPGTYNEAITCASWVHQRGIGPKGSVVIQQVDANVIILANNVQLENFTVRVVTPTAGRVLVKDNLVACTVRMTDLIFEITTPGAFNHQVFLFQGAGDYTIERCLYNIGGTAYSMGLRIATAASTIRLIDNDFTLTYPSSIHIYNTIACTITGKGNRWAGPCQWLLTGPGGTWTFDHDAILASVAWSTIESTNITFRECTIEAPVSAQVGSRVRLKNCSYRSISRTSTGNIVDESPQLQDAPWKVHKWTWQALLANSQVAVRGTPVNAGYGQVLLEVTDNVPGQEAVEQPADAAGSLDSSFTPARTPRFITQIAVDSFDAHVEMFFGLRQTLGNARPLAAEHHAGFDWNGTNFRAVSSDGAAIESTNLTTPTVNTLVRLELIIIGGVQVEFYVDGILVATHTTRRPTNALDWQHLLLTAGAGAGDLIQVTVRNGGCQECPS